MTNIEFIYPDDIPFQWDNLEFEEYLKENGQLKEYTSSLWRDRDMDKIRVCERISGGAHNYEPVLLSLFEGWEFACAVCGHLKSDFNIKSQQGMHEGHRTEKWEKKSFSDFCNVYLDWQFGDCNGTVEQIVRISYCYDCRVIFYYGSDDICSRCNSYDFTSMDEYEFFEFKIWVKEFVYKKLTGKKEVVEKL